MGIFEYVAVLTSIIIGLGIAHLLQGLARLIQRQGTEPPYWVHVCWVVYLLFTLVFWWWWEFRLGEIEVWTFQLYIFVVLYAVIMFLTASVMIPENLEGYDGYRDYFYSRRAWFFGLLGIAILIDVADSLVKGTDYWIALGSEYHIMNVAQPVLCVVAMFSRNPRFHGAFALMMLIHQASWAARQYSTAGPG